jgi:BNR/Asp-box repeat
MRKICSLFFFLFTIPVLIAQTENDAPLAIGNNYRIYPSSVTQTEVFIVRSPVDQNILFSACNTILFVPFFISEGIFVTTNAGTTWRGDDTCTGYPIEFHGGDPGITIDKNGTFILTRLGRTPFVGLYSHYSLDNGHTWSDQQVISTDDLERAALATDAVHGSPFAGRTYAAWTKLAQPFPLIFSYTDDGAKNWSVARAVNNPSTRSAGGDVVVGLNGNVYTCWAGVTETSPFKEIMVGFASSSNGGASWNVTENAFPVNGITGILTNKSNIRVNGLPSIAVDTTNGPRRGWIYIVTGQKNLAPAGSDPDIILYRSNDGGITWSPGIRVNQDPLNNGKTQYFPNLHIDKFGAVNVIFYDDRNTTTDSTGVFLARSIDGGTTWREFEISDHHFKPAPIGGLGQGYQGDVIDLTSTDTKLWPVWMDNSSGIYQVWTVPIDFSSVNGIDDNYQSLESSALEQNSPNPFRDKTTISYHVTKQGYVSMKVFDLLGDMVAEPIHELKDPGFYKVEFDPAVDENSDYSDSRIFICRLTLNDRVETRRMIFIR